MMTKHPRLHHDMKYDMYNAMIRDIESQGHYIIRQIIHSPGYEAVDTTLRSRIDMYGAFIEMLRHRVLEAITL
jgi:hypothetical protein